MVSSLTRTKRGLLPLFAQSIPGVFFTRLKKLQVLKVAYNELEVLPEEIGMLLCATQTLAVPPPAPARNQSSGCCREAVESCACADE